MAKTVSKIIKLQLPAGKATPAPPVGTMLGPVGINLQEFCTRYNEATRERMGDIIPVELSIYEDRTFDFVLKTPPTASLILKAAGVEKGSVKGANQIVATITKDQLKNIAEVKLPDLNTDDIEQAMKIITGTARNMGIAVKGINDTELAEQAAEAAEQEAEMARLEAELENMEAEAKEMADAEVPEVETTEQAEETETNEEEKKDE